MTSRGEERGDRGGRPRTAPTRDRPKEERRSDRGSQRGSDAGSRASGGSRTINPNREGPQSARQPRSRESGRGSDRGGPRSARQPSDQGGGYQGSPLSTVVEANPRQASYLQVPRDPN